MIRDTPIAAAVVATLAIAACAVPVAPTGGPADAVPPTLVDVQPPDGATNVSTDRIRLTFDEYISEGTFARAFSITPEPEQPPDISWRRRTVTIRLRSPLRESTTYRITIDRELRDLNNVELQSPVVTAFATGPTINRATLKGSIVDGTTGEAARSMDVFAYSFESATLDTLSSLPNRPLYRTQTDDRGNFELTYLSEGEYFVVGVADGNANRMPDAGERTAFPNDPTAYASESAPDSLVMYAAVNDGTAPSLRLANASSKRRFEVVFTEAVLLGGERGRPDGWSVSDSMSALDAGAYPIERLFISPRGADRVMIETSAIPDSISTVRIVTGVVRDSLGNETSPGAEVFAAVSQRADTTRTRLLGIRPVPATDDSVATVSPHERIVVALNQSLPPETWLSMTGPDSTTTFEYSWTTADGRSYELAPRLPVGTEAFLLRVHAGRLDDSLPSDSIATHRFRQLRAGELGEISGVIRPDSTVAVGDIYADVRRSGTPDLVIPAPVQPSGAFKATGLRPGRYVLRTFVDLDGNGRWTPATFPPHEAGEPVVWVTDSLEVRSRFETVLPDPVTIP